MAKIAVIGAGPSGMMAAGQAAKLGHQVDLYEKNTLVGKKIYITGKGRCNITNDSDVETHLENIPGNPYFLYSALYGFDSQSTIAFFEELGVKTKVERGNRVFPVSDKAADVAQAMERFLRKAGVRLHLQKEVAQVLVEEGRVTGIRLKNGETKAADAVIVATGGLSYPGTGSTGDGYGFARACGHKVTALAPSLVPLRCRESWCAQLMGLTLKNVKIVMENKQGKRLYDDFGELLFTHFGVSGPVILSASRHLIGHFEENITLKIDLKPALSEKELDLRLLRDFEKIPNKQFSYALDALLPKKLIPVMIDLSGIMPEKKVNSITKEERKRLLGLLKALPLSVTGAHGFGQAVATKGGVDVDEVNPSTMESKLVRGLYFAGEVLDLDGYTGGFNLQIAFATGYAAGRHAGGEGE